MEEGKTRVVEDGNTIYEIDLDCMNKKKMQKQRGSVSPQSRKRKMSSKRVK